ncbi:hypothetical protein HDV01_004909 [Terramyces sp. JEL0728]|nr:hypothetical protein HDV01_004909 [Terramyces sp. JEL0728]
MADDVAIEIIDLLKSLSSSPEELKNYGRVAQNLIELKEVPATESKFELIQAQKPPEKRRIEDHKPLAEKRPRQDRPDNRRPFDRQHDRPSYERTAERQHGVYERYERNGDWERREYRKEYSREREAPRVNREEYREDYRDVLVRREEYPDPANAYSRYRESVHTQDSREYRDRHREPHRDPPRDPPRDYPRDYRGKRPQDYRPYDREYRR